MTCHSDHLGSSFVINLWSLVMVRLLQFDFAHVNSGQASLKNKWQTLSKPNNLEPGLYKKVKLMSRHECVLLIETEFPAKK